MWYHSDLHGMRSAARFNIVRNAQALGVDDAHAVGKTVGGEDAFAVGRDGDAPGTASHVLSNRFDDFVVSSGNNIDGVRSAACDVNTLTVGGNCHFHGPAVEPQVDGLDHFKTFSVNHADRTADFCGYVREGTVRRELYFPGAVAYEDVF